MTTLKITQIGNSLGVVLPKELLARLHVDKGDVLHVTEVPDGFAIRTYDEKFARVMAAAEIVMREDRDVLRRLAE